MTSGTSPEALREVAREPEHRNVPRWRWALWTLIVGAYPLGIALLTILSELRGRPSRELPSQPALLFFATLIELAIFGVIWAVGTLAVRPRRDQLWIRDAGLGATWGGGLLYSIGLRIGAAVVITVAGAIAVRAGASPEEIARFLKGGGGEALFDPKQVFANPLYALLLTTWVSFVVAGLREELWRAGTLRGLLELLPSRWSDNVKIALAIGISSAIFAIGHLRQGIIACALIFFIGAGLGAVLLGHRSIWPAVVAHGFFNATTFILAGLVEQRGGVDIAAWF